MPKGPQSAGVEGTEVCCGLSPRRSPEWSPLSIPGSSPLGPVPCRNLSNPACFQGWCVSSPPHPCSLGAPDNHSLRGFNCRFLQGNRHRGLSPVHKNARGFLLAGLDSLLTRSG